MHDVREIKADRTNYVCPSVNFKTAGRILIKLGMGIMPLETSLYFYFQCSTIELATLAPLNVGLYNGVRLVDIRKICRFGTVIICTI